MPELALDDRQRDPFVGHLDRVGVAELVWREPTPDPAAAAVRPSWRRADAGSQLRPAVGPWITQNNGPTGNRTRSCCQGSSCSHAQRSIPTSRRLSPLPCYAGAVVMPSRVAGGRLLAAERRVGGLIGSA